MSRYKRTHAIRGNVKIGRYLLESEIKHVLREFAKASREKKRLFTIFFSVRA